MRKYIFLIILIICGISPVLGYFSNPGFETGNFSGWASSTSPLTITTNPVNSGEYSAGKVITTTGANQYLLKFANLTDIPAGYHVGYWYRINASQGGYVSNTSTPSYPTSSFIGFSNTTTAQWGYYYVDGDLIMDDSWHYFETETINGFTTSNMWFYWLLKGKVEFYVDDFYQGYESQVPPDELICDFQIEPYPAQPGQVLTLTDLTEGGTPTAYDWMVKNPMGIWDNSTMGEEQNATYLLGYGGYYTFSHKVFLDEDSWECSYDYFGGTNYTSVFNVTPTLIGNFSVNLTKNITGTFDDLNLTVIDKNFFSNQIHNMTYFGNYSHAWTEFCDNMTGVVNLTFNEVEDRINPFLYLTDLLLQGHNMYVALMIPLLGFTSFPLLITSAVVNIIPVPIQMLISFGLLIDFVFLVLRGPD